RAPQGGAELWQASARVRADVPRRERLRRPRSGTDSTWATAMSERGLGRGLGALIPRATVGLREIPVDAIRPNPWQPRTHFDEQELEELAQSIREHGVLQPVLVSQQQDGSFQLITGERRWRAVQLAGLTTVPALVKEATPK